MASPANDIATLRHVYVVQNIAGHAFQAEFATLSGSDMARPPASPGEIYYQDRYLWRGLYELCPNPAATLSPDKEDLDTSQRSNHRY